MASSSGTSCKLHLQLNLLLLHFRLVFRDFRFAYIEATRRRRKRRRRPAAEVGGTFERFCLWLEGGRGGGGWLSTRREQKVSVLKSRHVRMLHKVGGGGEERKE